MSATRVEDCRLAVIVARVDASPDDGSNLEAIIAQTRGRGRVLLLDASGESSADLTKLDGLTFREVKPGRLVPELWAEGLRASTEPWVVLTTASMCPMQGWLDALLQPIETTDAVAVGGAIEPDPALGAFDRAVYLHRYIGYHRPLAPGVAPVLPGENVLYRREALHRVTDLWRDGFWEVEVNARLRELGATLAVSEEAALRFTGGTRPLSFLRQRFRHALHFGRSRAEGWTLLPRAWLVVTLPLVPWLMFARVLGSARRKGLTSLVRIGTLISLAWMLGVWALGEAFGVLTSGRSRMLSDALNTGRRERAGGPRALSRGAASLSRETAGR